MFMQLAFGCPARGLSCLLPLVAFLPNQEGGFDAALHCFSSHLPREASLLLCIAPVPHHVEACPSGLTCRTRCCSSSAAWHSSMLLVKDCHCMLQLLYWYCFYCYCITCSYLVISALPDASWDDAQFCCVCSVLLSFTRSRSALL